VEILLYVLQVFVRLVLYTELTCIFAGVIISWIAPDTENIVTDVIYFVTEPVIMPVRSLLDRLIPVEEFPFDLSVLVTSIILFVLLLFL